MGRVGWALVGMLALGAGVCAGQTVPADAKAAPPVAATLIPVGDGVASSSINTVIFRHSSIVTYEQTQYVAYYDKDAHVVLAKRTLGGAGSQTWEVKRTELTGNVSDAHNTISLGVDGNGIVHMAWDHHGANLNYVQTKEAGSLELTEKMKMDGARENQVTYPEFYTVPEGAGGGAAGKIAGGDMIFLYRVGSSGNGDLVMKHYSAKEKKWSTVAQNLVAGEGRANAYPEFAVGPDGTMHLGWVWRGSPDVASNHNVCYARSSDGGVTWTDAAGKKVALPITAATGEVAVAVPEKSELINQTTMAGDAQGHPYIATYYREAGATVPQYHVVYHDGKAWHAVQVGERKTPFTLAGGGTKRIPISRPLMMVDPAGKKVMVVIRDVERGDKATVVTTEDVTAAKPVWTYTDLTTESWGSWEPSFDPVRWQRDHVLDLFVQKTDQLDGNDGSGRTLPPTKVNVLEYKP